MTTSADVAGTRSGQRFVWMLASVSLVPFLVAPALDLAGAEPGLWTVLVVALGAPHVGTTLVFYFDRDLERDVDRFVLAPLAAVGVALAVGFVAPEAWLPYLVAAFLGWQLHHFTRQNLGCLAFLCRARRMPGPTPRERRMLDLTTIAGVCAIPSALVDLPGGDVLAMVGLVVLGAAAVQGWLAARGAHDPIKSVALGFAVVFYLPLFLFAPGPALLGYALAHGAQYVLMVGHIPTARRAALGLVAGFVVIGLPLHWAMTHTSQPVVFGLFYGVTAAHFLIDAATWKMRTPEQRAYMRRRFAFLSSQESPASR